MSGIQLGADGAMSNVGAITLKNITAPGAPGSTLGVIYKRAGGSGLYYKADAVATEVDLTAVGGGNGSVADFRSTSGLVSTANSGTIVYFTTVPFSTAADTAATLYEVRIRMYWTSAGQFASQEMTMQNNLVTFYTRPQWETSNGTPQYAEDAVVISLTPGSQSIRIGHRLTSFTSGATGSVNDFSITITKLRLV